MNGNELARGARKRRPLLKVLLTTGFGRASMQNGDHADSRHDLLSKPYTKVELATKLRTVLDRR
jgi:hypothetical protein